MSLKLLDYAFLDVATAPMTTARRLPGYYDDTRELPAIPAITLHVHGYDAATLDALAFESGTMPETLIARWIREKAYARQLEREDGR